MTFRKAFAGAVLALFSSVLLAPSVLAAGIVTMSGPRLYVDAGGGSSPLNVVLAATRTSGPAPLSVVFDTIDSTHTDSEVDTRLEVGYCFDFHDPGSGTWEYSDSHSKNTYCGAGSALHVFETPGTYTVLVRGRDASGNTDQEQIVVTVSNPDTVYSGTNTVCISTNTTTTGCPSGATLVTNATAIPTITSSKRYLFNRGQDFRSLTGSISVAQLSDVQIGAFGTGARPITNSVTVQGGNPDSTGFNWPQRNVFMDLDVRGTVDGTLSHHNTLLFRVRVNQSSGRPINVGANILYYMAAAGAPAQAALEWPTNFHIVESQLIDGDASNTVAIWNYSRGTWFVGSEADPQQEHALRFPLNDRGGVQFSWLHGIGGAIRHAIKWHAVGLNPFDIKPSVEIEPSSGYVVAGYNWIGSPSEPVSNDWAIVLAPQNSDSAEGVWNGIVEGNTFFFDYDQEVVLGGKNLLSRGNVMDASVGGTATTATGGHHDSLPNPSWRGSYSSTSAITTEAPVR